MLEMRALDGVEARLCVQSVGAIPQLCHGIERVSLQRLRGSSGGVPDGRVDGQAVVMMQVATLGKGEQEGVQFGGRAGFPDRFEAGRKPGGSKVPHE